MSERIARSEASSYWECLGNVHPVGGAEKAETTREISAHSHKGSALPPKSQMTWFAGRYSILLSESDYDSSTSYEPQAAVAATPLQRAGPVGN